MELSEIRAEIDKVDDQMLTLLMQRMDLAEKVAAYKKEHHLPVLNSEREQAVLNRVALRAGSREREARRLFTTLFELARNRQSELIDGSAGAGQQVRASLSAGQDAFPQTGTVACQGTADGSAAAACNRLLPCGSIVYVRNSDAVFSAVESGQCQFGVLPAETVSRGAAYDLLRHRQFSVVRGVRLHIRQEPPVPHDPETACDSMQDSDISCTRFLCIAREPAIYAGADRVGLLFTCKNTPDALDGVLSTLASQGVGIAKLESLPVAGGNSELLFFLELRADLRQEGVLHMLEELERGCTRFQFLGAYAEV